MGEELHFSPGFPILICLEFAQFPIASLFQRNLGPGSMSHEILSVGVQCYTPRLWNLGVGSENYLLGRLVGVDYAEGTLTTDSRDQPRFNLNVSPNVLVYKGTVTSSSDKSTWYTYHKNGKGKTVLYEYRPLSPRV